MKKNYIKEFHLFGVRFINGDYNTAFKRIKKGGLMIVPSAPGLATIGLDSSYSKAVQNADFAIPDSGYMVMLIRLLKGKKIKKLSGFEFMKNFFKENYNEDELFLVDPNDKESRINNKYLNSIGIPIHKKNHYIAPIYKKNSIIKDQELIYLLNNLSKKPKYIMINLGSNVQEPLGYYLKERLNFKPGIICVGAAISFFTGSQADISFFDRYYLGWLKRCLVNPKIFIPRYLKAFSLFFIILKADLKVYE